ncbi:MAG: PD40 domain-containing protein [Candidatus Hydrogenedentes bacterium]|nr:PD40 domain-containing protein [Candidatus Hydrogenedentota bacterium]
MKVMHQALVCLLVALAAAAHPQSFVLEPPAAGIPAVSNLRQVTQGPKHHFFGYYGIYPWDLTGRFLLCLETEFSDRLPDDGDRATVQLIDLDTGEARAIASTAAWNFQQGALAHWLGVAPDRLIVFNDRTGTDLHATVLDVQSGERRSLPRPVAAVSPDGRMIASVNYARLRDMRPGYGYAGVADPFGDQLHPADDGLYLMKSDSGESRLIVSLDQLYQLAPPPDQYSSEKMWFNHVLFSRDNQRVFFLARYKNPVGALVTAAFTVSTDGRGLRCVIPYDWGASHFDWGPDRQMCVTSRFEGGAKWLHVLFTDGEQNHRPLLPDLLQQDGHCHFSPDGKWLVTDTYPSGKERMQHVYLVNLEKGQAGEVAAFHEPRAFAGDWRCDLHPRWSRDGRQICIDSTHDGTRQIYILTLNNGTSDGERS